MSTVAWLVVKHLKFSRPWCEVQHMKWQKDWTLKTSSDKLAESNNYAYVFHESGFTSCITVKYWLEQDIQSLSECKSLHVCFSGEEGNLVECFSLFVDKTILLSCLIMVIPDSLLGDTDTLVCPFAACVNQVPLYLLLKTLTQLSKMVPTVF